MLNVSVKLPKQTGALSERFCTKTVASVPDETAVMFAFQELCETGVFCVITESFVLLC